MAILPKEEVSPPHTHTQGTVFGGAGSVESEGSWEPSREEACLPLPGGDRLVLTAEVTYTEALGHGGGLAAWQQHTDCDKYQATGTWSIQVALPHGSVTSAPTPAVHIRSLPILATTFTYPLSSHTSQLT